MYTRIDIDEVKDFIVNQTPQTKIYIGGDSERIMIDGIWYADYTLAVVVHLDGKHGCKIFGDVQRERDYEKRRDRPRMRLMTEVYKISELYLQLADVLEDREIEIHLDINPNEKYASSCVVQEAIGYIRGMCNVMPMVKPKAFAASYCADRLKEIMVLQQKFAA